MDAPNFDLVGADLYTIFYMQISCMYDAHEKLPAVKVFVVINLELKGEFY